MNILEIEFPFKIEAKISKYNNKANIMYTIAEPNYTTCINKKEILIEQIKSCENLLRCTNNKNDIGAIENEISELKLALDVLI